MKQLLLTFVLLLNYAFAQTPASIEWHNFKEINSLQNKHQKKVFIDVFTDWCGWCKRMDATTFTNPVIIKLMNQHFYAVKFNAETSDTINYKGKNYTKLDNRKQSPNSFASLLLNDKLSYPTTVYLDENQNSLGPVPGYLEPKMMEKILHYFGEDFYKTTPWQDFEKTFKGELK